MSTRIIGGKDISEIMSQVGPDQLMDEIISSINDFCKHSMETTDVRERDGFHYSKPNLGLLEWMPSYKKDEQATIKIIGYHPENPTQLGLPTIIGSIGVYDTKTGAMKALADGTLPTALRTGAASAAASLMLAHPDSSVLGILGSGAQAVTQAHALLRCFPIKRILVCDILENAENSFADRVSSFCPPDVLIEILPQQELVAQSDILCTCTSIGVGEGPLFENPIEIKPHLHINAVGSDFPGKVELPEALLSRSFVVPDHLEQCIKEGECQQMDPKSIGPAMGQLIRDKQHYQNAYQQITVFDSTGWAVEDQIMMEIILKHADNLNLGTSISLHSTPIDALNPYEH